MYVLRFSTYSSGMHDNADRDNDVERLELNVAIHTVLRRRCHCGGVKTKDCVEDARDNDDNDDENSSGSNNVGGSIGLGREDGGDDVVEGDDSYDRNNHRDSDWNNRRKNVASLDDFYLTLARRSGYCCCAHGDGRNVLIVDLTRVSSVLVTTDIRNCVYSANNDERATSSANNIVVATATTGGSCLEYCKTRVDSCALFLALARNIELTFDGSDINNDCCCSGRETGCTRTCCADTGGSSNTYRLVRVTAGEYLLEVHSSSEDDDRDGDEYGKINRFRNECNRHHHSDGGSTLHRVRYQLIDICRDTLVQTALVRTNDVRYELRDECITLLNEELRIDDRDSFYTRLGEAAS